MLSLISSMAVVQPVCAGAPAVSPGPPSLSPTLQAFWDDCVAITKQRLGDDFTVALQVYRDGADLPFGAPGNPAQDFTTRDGPMGLLSACGVPQKNPNAPYKGCPAPGLPASSDVLAECCRHFAYCVPYTPNARAPKNQVSTVVVSPRINSAPAATAQGILVHEIGHCIDFHAFGARYSLLDTGIEQSVWQQEMSDIDAREQNFEVRADLFANLVLREMGRGKLCYSAATRLQTIVSEGSGCLADGELMDHYVHGAPMRGRISP